MDYKNMLINLVSIATVIIVSGTAQAATYVNSPPLATVITASHGSVKSSGATRVPVITWGGDMATILANGNSISTTSQSLFGQKGLNLKLVREDDFKKQVGAYIRGESPYLRGTMGMINMAAPLLSRNPATRPVIIYQMTWSNGGDCLVVKKGINSTRDLKGKTIAVQAYGPHVDYLATIIKDAGLAPGDVEIKWVKDLTGTDNTPGEAFYDNSVDGAFVIIPDGLMLTSNGTVGTGAEGSVKGAKIMLSTKTANRIIADVYAVRSDYLSERKKEVENFVHGLMLGEQAIKDLFKNKASRTDDYRNALTASARILLDSAQATGDSEALFGDVEFAGFTGNVKFFADKNWPRNMENLNREITRSFTSIGLISSAAPIGHAGWDYNALKKGLTGTADVVVPRFNKDEVAKVVAKKQAMGTLGEGELFSFEINFQPNQNGFSQDLYAGEFKKVVALAATYGGAIITVEGHSDPHKYSKEKKKGASDITLKRIKQAAKNLSVGRALSVRDSIKQYARSKNVPLDDSQLTVVGHGITKPKYPRPKTKDQWLQNMRVVFRIIQVEAEDSVFEPL